VPIIAPFTRTGAPQLPDGGVGILTRTPEIALQPWTLGFGLLMLSRDCTKNSVISVMGMLCQPPHSFRVLGHPF
jgi:hypothetical protein